MTRFLPIALLLAAGAALGGCNSLFGVDDFRRSDGTPALGGDGGENGGGGAGGGGVGVGGIGGAGGDAGASAGGAGGSGGTPVLSDDGLAFRYLIDEAEAGTDPGQLIDQGPSPLALGIDYSGVQFVSAETGRGLHFDGNQTGRAHGQLDNPKVQLLDGAQKLTVEIVASVEIPLADVARVFQLSNQSENGGLLGMTLDADTSQPAADFMDLNGMTDNSAEWDAALGGAGRMVLHVVYDTTELAPTDRVKLYVDGVQRAPTAMPTAPILPPVLNQALDTNTNSHLVLGNRPAADKAMTGTLYYFAIYTVAFDQTRVDVHHAALAGSDD